RALFALAPTDVGRPLQDLEVSFRPVELRAAIQESLIEGHPRRVGEASWRRAGGPELSLDIEVVPLQAESGDALGAIVTFSDVTRHAELRDELERSKRELEVAYEELQSTVEELETTNEELQSTNEELETTNEELQSTNEELETTNQELQSTNEELEAINDELRRRTDELHRVNGFLESIMGGLESGIVVVDREL